MLALPSPKVVRSLHQLTGLDSKGIGNLAKHGDTGRHVTALDGADVAHAEASAMGQFLLRQLLVMARLTQISRHNLLEIHDKMGTSIGTIVLGMIVPIRVAVCYILAAAALGVIVSQATDCTGRNRPPTSYELQ